MNNVQWITMKNDTPLKYELDSEIEKKYQKRDNKKAKQMKVSGKSVFKIKKIISNKGKLG